MDQMKTHEFRSAFSLVELLTVIAIMAILVALATPSFRAVSGGLAIEQAGQEASQALVTARDLALARNCWTEVRVINTPSDNGTPTFRALQVWQRNDDGTAKPVSRASYLPKATAFAEDPIFSSLLGTNSPVQGTMKIAGTDCSYVGLLVCPDGTPDLASYPTNATASLTVVPERERNTGTLPPNFRSLCINPVTGEVRMFRP
jgi:uncharacterized protein (TIGR02596 family)